jgi:C1A family cysteine protease
VIPVILCDLRNSFGAVRNQGDRPTCIAFAVSDAHAAARGAFAELSVEHLFYHAVQRTPVGHPAQGVNFPRILEALHLDGQAAESGWPYLSALPANLSLWVPPAGATPVFKRGSQGAAGAITTIMAQLDAAFPVVVTFMATMAFCVAEDGIVRPRTPDSDVDWHAVIAVGHGQSSGRPFLLVRNSWGETWGMGGYAWVDIDYLVPRLSGFATMK